MDIGSKHSALFLSTTMNSRIAAHFERLRAQVRELLDVHLVVNPSDIPKPVWSIVGADAERLMPTRWAAMCANDGLIPGYVDLLWLPLGLAAQSPYVWMIEFDVDYAGDWSEFFGRFMHNDADVLTTTLQNWADVPSDWAHRPSAAAPARVETTAWRRCFHPIMRLSQRFMRAYVDETQSPDWRGHSEFTIPTIATHRRMIVKDIANSGGYYTNNPLDRNLGPGTFIYRPARTAYFHERSDTFEQPSLLYHPVKPEYRRSRRQIPRRLLQALPRALAAEIKRLCVATIGASEDLCLDLSASLIARMPIAGSKRAELLLGLSTRMRGEGWPRPYLQHFAPNRVDLRKPAAELARLQHDNLASIRSVLLRHIKDGRRLTGWPVGRETTTEATVADVAMGILSLACMAETPALLDGLMAAGAPFKFWRFLTKEIPNHVSSWAITRLAGPEPLDVLVNGLRPSLPDLDPQRRLEAAAALRPLLADPDPKLAFEAAATLRRMEPEAEAAWDVLAKAIAAGLAGVGHILRPIPSGRLEAASDLAKHAAQQLGGSFIISPCGTSAEEERVLASAAEDWWMRYPFLRADIARAAENRLIRLDAEPAGRAWLPLSEEIARSGTSSERGLILFGAFTWPPQQGADRIRQALIDKGVSIEEMLEVFRLSAMCRAPAWFWLPAFDAVIKRDPEEALKAVAFHVSFHGSTAFPELASAALTHLNTVSNLNLKSNSQNCLEALRSGVGALECLRAYDPMILR